MSHVTTVKTELKDLGTIKEALQFLGISFTENATVNMWRKSDNFQADVVIKIPNYMYDIGIVQEEDGIRLQADSMAWGRLAAEPCMKAYNGLPHEGFKEQFMGILKQACNIVNVKKIAAARGERVTFSAPDQHGIIHGKVENTAFGV